MTLNILIAPSGFKESLSVLDVTEAIADGVRAVLPDARILKAPLVDGGEGFTEALVQATGGALHPVTVTGPVGEPVAAHFGFLGNAPVRTAVLEMAAAAGLRLVPRDRRDPCLTTSRGVGELILAALDAGAERILLGCGDSGINDGGAGMAQALGARLLDADGREIGARAARNWPDCTALTWAASIRDWCRCRSKPPSTGTTRCSVRAAWRGCSPRRRARRRNRRPCWKPRWRTTPT